MTLERPHQEVARTGSDPGGSCPARRGARQGQGGADDLVQEIARAQQGCPTARERLVAAFVPFVLRAAQQVCRRRLRLGRDDEVSVAMVAFLEAIERYRPLRGSSFAAFARMVIQHRVIDALRRSRARSEVPVSCLALAPLADSVDLNLREAEMREAMLAYQEAFGAIEHREELLAYRRALDAHGITLSEAIHSCPHHGDARARAIAAARAVAEDPAWRAHLLAKRALPLKEMVASRRLGVSRTTLERHRRYIVAVALLFCLRQAGTAARPAAGLG